MDNSGSFSHPTVQDRKLRIRLFSWLMWIGGTLATVVTFFYAGLLALVIWPIAFALGLPLPNIGPPHVWLQRTWERRQQWRRDHGVAMAPPLTRSPDDEPCKIERAQFVNALVEFVDEEEETKATDFLPILTTEERNDATVVLTVPGASELWLQADHYGKYTWEQMWFEEVSNALGVTTIDRLEVAMTRVHRPANKERALAHAYRRGNPAILDADGSNGETVESQLADNLAERIDRVYGMAGLPREYCFIRTPWPTKWGRRIGLENVEGFRESPVYLTAQEMLEAYKTSSIEAEFLSRRGTQNMWDHFWRLRDIEYVHMLEARDKAVALLSDSDTTGDDIPLDKGVVIRRSAPGTSGYIDYNGTIHLAGYVTKFKYSQVTPGFRRGLTLPPDVYWASTIYIEAKRSEGESRKAREKERGWTMIAGINPLEEGLSNPNGDPQLQEAIERRRQIAEAGNRVSRHYMLRSVAADSLREAENRWDDLVTVESRLGYTIERVHDPDDIEDILLTQFGFRAER